MLVTKIFLSLAAASAVSAMQIPRYCKETRGGPLCSQWDRPVAMKSAPVEHLEHLERRGLAEDIRMKNKCKDSFKSDKAKYKEPCKDVQAEDARNACMLRGLVDDAAPECKKALLKSLGF